MFSSYKMSHNNDVIYTPLMICYINFFSLSNTMLTRTNAARQIIPPFKVIIIILLSETKLEETHHNNKVCIGWIDKTNRF